MPLSFGLWFLPKMKNNLEGKFSFLSLMVNVLRQEIEIYTVARLPSKYLSLRAAWSYYKGLPTGTWCSEKGERKQNNHLRACWWCWAELWQWFQRGSVSSGNDFGYGSASVALVKALWLWGRIPQDGGMGVWHSIKVFVPERHNWDSVAEFFLFNTGVQTLLLRIRLWKLC